MAKGKILVVDDDSNLLEVIKMRLESAGYEVLTALSGVDAIEKVKKNFCDLAIIDLQLAEMDGISLMSDVHGINPELPVIILTAHGTIESAVEAIQRGAFNFLTKPFDPKDLLFQIEKALEKSRLAAEVKKLSLGNKRLTDEVNRLKGLILSVVSGLVFLLASLIIAVIIPEPTPFQSFVFRIVIALAAAAFGATIPGLLQIKLPFWGKGVISATGALGLFILIYNVNPPELILQSQTSKSQKVIIVKQQLNGTILDQNNDPLPGAVIVLSGYAISDISDNQGAFSFEIEAQKKAIVNLVAKKSGFITLKGDAILGTTNIVFKMEELP